MGKDTLERNSKFLALILRHKPEAGNIVLDKNGWAEIMDVVNNAGFTLKQLNEIVMTDSKGRYEISEDGGRIRAVQGHSIKSVEVELEKLHVPPGELFHGTKRQFMEQIKKKGLLPMNRHHVHMTDNLKTARETADRRHGESVILVIDSCQMAAKGYKFYKSKNGVFHADEIPWEFISELKTK